MIRLSFGLVLVLVALSDAAAQTSNPVVVIDTNHGVIKLELFADKAPLTVKNFLQYADDRFYDGTIIHRIIPHILIQGGGHGPDLKEKKTRQPIQDESGNGLRHLRGTIAVARANDPNSGTSQFFINTTNNDYLDRFKPGYAVFGKVSSGMDVVDKIKAVPNGNRGTLTNVPLEDIVVRSIRRASQFSVAVSGQGVYAVGRTFMISATIEYPVGGQFLTLELPAGLQRVESKEIQPVVADDSVGLVLWRVRATEPGEYECQVRSSTGGTQRQKVRIHAPEKS